MTETLDPPVNGTGPAPTTRKTRTVAPAVDFALYDALDTGAFVVDRDYCIRYVNRQARTELAAGGPGIPDIDPDTLVGVSFEVIYTHPELGARLTATDEHLPLTDRVTSEVTTHDASFAAIRDASGAYVGALVTFEDVTERLRVEQQMAIASSMMRSEEHTSELQSH